MRVLLLAWPIPTLLCCVVCICGGAGGAGGGLRMGCNQKCHDWMGEEGMAFRVRVGSVCSNGVQGDGEKK